MRPVRHELSPLPRSRRGLDERLVARTPWVVGVWGRLIARLPPSSRVRQVLLVRAVHVGLAAYSRGDLDFVLLGHHPDAEYHGPPDEGELGTLGLRGPTAAMTDTASLTPSGAAPGTHIGSSPRS
jgi:hypothetical protein